MSDEKKHEGRIDLSDLLEEFQRDRKKREEQPKVAPPPRPAGEHEGRIDLSDLLEQVRAGRAKKAPKPGKDVRELERQIAVIDQMITELKREPKRITTRENIERLEKQKAGIERRIAKMTVPEVPTEYDPLTLKDSPKYATELNPKHVIQRKVGEGWEYFRPVREEMTRTGFVREVDIIGECGGDLRKTLRRLQRMHPKDTFRIGRVFE